MGTVNDIELQNDKSVLVTFDADRTVVLTTGTKAAVRYLNLTGDRYLELLDGPGSTRVLPAGAQIPKERTAGALDLDLLLGGLRPVVQGLNPQDVNALTSALVQIFQGQGTTLDSLLSKTSSFSTTLADNSAVVQQLIDNLRTVVDTIGKDGDKFSDAIDRLEQLVSGLSQDRDPIGTAITALDSGTASLTDLLTQRGRRWPVPSTSSTAWRPFSTTIRSCSTGRCSGALRTTGNWRGWARTAVGSCTTSAGCRSGSPICRAGPRSSP